VGRVPLLVLMVVVGMLGGALWLSGDTSSDEPATPTPTVAMTPTPTTTPRSATPTTPPPAETASPTPNATATLPPLVRVNAILGQIYDAPGEPGTLTVPRDTVLQVQAVVEADGETYYAVTGDVFAGTRYIPAASVVPLP